ncbi:hypothetical protein MASR2M15_23540 [Anaerolineales bacterium]
MRYLSTLMIMILMIGIGATAGLAQSGATTPPPMTYLFCDWGLLMIDESTNSPTPFLKIESPAYYSAVEGNQLMLSGTGGGLFENNIVVEVSSFEGNVLFEGTTMLNTESVGGEGTWSIDIDLGAIEPNTETYASVYSTSPADGGVSAYETVQVNMNSSYGLPYVTITQPLSGATVMSAPLVVEGMAGGAFENNIVIEIRDYETGNPIAETYATIETDEMGGSGAFRVELDIEAELGSNLEIFAYQPDMQDGDDIRAWDMSVVSVDTLAQSYDRILVIKADDPLLWTDDLCGATGAEFDHEDHAPLLINDVMVQESKSMTPLVNLSIDAAGSSLCADPIRIRVERTENQYEVEVYRDLSDSSACTDDLAPIPLIVSLGTQPNPDFTIRVNGEVVR